MYSKDEWIRHGDELRRPFPVPDGFSSSEHVVIVGGGLSGLTIAYRLASKRPICRLLLLNQKAHSEVSLIPGKKVSGCAMLQ